MDQDCNVDARSLKVFANSYWLRRGVRYARGVNAEPWRLNNSRCMKEVATGGSSNGRKKVKRFVERVALVAQAAHGARASETLCRKGGTSRSDNAPHASGARAGAKLACGATLSATREFVGLAWLVNSARLRRVFLFCGIILDSCPVLQLYLQHGIKYGSNKKPRHLRDAV